MTFMREFGNLIGSCIYLLCLASSAWALYRTRRLIHEELKQHWEGIELAHRSVAALWTIVLGQKPTSSQDGHLPSTQNPVRPEANDPTKGDKH